MQSSDDASGCRYRYLARQIRILRCLLPCDPKCKKGGKVRPCIFSINGNLSTKHNIATRAPRTLHRGAGKIEGASSALHLDLDGRQRMHNGDQPIQRKRLTGFHWTLCATNNRAEDAAIALMGQECIQQRGGSVRCRETYLLVRKKSRIYF